MNLFIIPLFLFTCLSGVVILNYEDISFSLPRSVLNSYIIIQLIKPVKDIKKLIIFIVSLTITLMLILAWFLSSFSIPEQYQKEIIFIIFVISLFLSLILYSETTKIEINRKKIQFVFSMLTFLIFLALNIYQMVIYISKESSSETNMIIAITILGLILSMVTAIDKTRCLFEAVIELKKQEINDIWNTLNKKYSYRIGLKIVDDKRSEITEIFEIIKIKWNTGDWKIRVKLIGVISIFILAESFMVIFMFNQRKVDYYINLFFTNIKDLVLGLFNGDEKKASLAFVIIVIMGIIVWLFNNAKKRKF